MLRDGVSGGQVARTLTVDRRTVYAIRDAHGIPNWYTDPSDPVCRHGHAWPQHLDIQPSGRHECRECRRIRNRNRYEPVDVTYVDEFAVELAVSGQPAHLTSFERRVAVRELLNHDLSGSQMAARIGCTPRTIWRIRKQLREAA